MHLIYLEKKEVKETWVKHQYAEVHVIVPLRKFISYTYSNSWEEPVDVTSGPKFSTEFCPEAVAQLCDRYSDGNTEGGCDHDGGY